MTLKAEAVVKIYKQLAEIPALLDAKLSNKGNVIYSLWSQRNLEKGKTTKFLKTILLLEADLTKVTETLPLDVSNELLSALSPSEKFRAVLRDDDDKQYLEIWQSQSLHRIVDLNALDLHGKVYADGEFKSFVWSPDELKLLYIAEKKPPKSEPFYKRKAPKTTSNDQTIIPGQEHLYLQDWGEQLVGKKQSVIAEYNVEADVVSILNGTPGNICPAQIAYSPDGQYIVGIAYETTPRKLGLIYCSNRPSSIFSLDLKGNYAILSENGKSVKSPVFTPDGKLLLWLERSAGGPHSATMTIVKSEFPKLETTHPKVVVDIVQDEIKIANDRRFCGLYTTNFIARCWASGNRLVLCSNQGNAINIYVVDIDNGKITELEYTDGSQIILDIKDDTLLINRRNFFVPDVLLMGKLPAKGFENSIEWTALTSNKKHENLEASTFSYLDLTQTGDDSVKTFTAVYIGPTSGSDKSVPLIIWPHGGPHSASTNNFALEISLMLSLGFALLLVNYRGSTGAGEKSVRFLLGRIGVSDVSDCILAANKAMEQFKWIDPSKLALLGGSHGGFLVTHLSGQYPDMFKAVVSRNPVIDVASMSTTSDIPDWTFVECGSDFTQKGAPDGDILTSMRKASPIEHAHKVKAPTLLQIGSNDLRVPALQATDYYHRLKANGVVVRMNLYDDNHPLGTVPNELDNLINSALWIDEHINK